MIGEDPGNVNGYRHNAFATQNFAVSTAAAIVGARGRATTQSAGSTAKLEHAKANGDTSLYPGKPTVSHFVLK